MLHVAVLAIVFIIKLRFHKWKSVKETTKKIVYKSLFVCAIHMDMH